ncbi:MAG: hypothetical protein HGA28_05655 [Anaerolineaceae bacterium]|nr:hypothetical protein [Anaerolineaceae bacterium]
MKTKLVRAVLAVVVVLGIALMAKGQVAWADQDNATDSVVTFGQSELAILPAKPGPGSVKPPPQVFYACENGIYSVGGVATIEIKDLKPGYCIEAVLWNPRFQIHRLPDGAGSPLAHMLFLRVYLNGRLVYDVPPGDGTVETCYALPPDKEAQFYFYDFYGKRFNKRTELPRTWDTLDTRVDTDKKTACAFTQVSGVYGLIGK